MSSIVRICVLNISLHQEQVSLCVDRETDFHSLKLFLVYLFIKSKHCFVSTEKLTQIPYKNTTMGIKYFWKYLASLNVVEKMLGLADFKREFGVVTNVTAAMMRPSASLAPLAKDPSSNQVIRVVLKEAYFRILTAADDGKRRMPKSFYEKLDSLVRRSIVVHDDVKTQLAAALKKALKVEPVMAPGEADVFIG
ncbi:hypothetical protein SeMB42_g06461 [Synchytrium endobioticum]|uniref:Uncharacterized protein n=1 Tax=Synchytrium endobioticum TaxID=286115 RepID=A0A507CC61_9FUNG|nr:hypothetical protein SeMB42_g06461 [Synchytrium endobioticum]